MVQVPGGCFDIEAANVRYFVSRVLAGVQPRFVNVPNSSDRLPFLARVPVAKSIVMYLRDQHVFAGLAKLATFTHCCICTGGSTEAGELDWACACTTAVPLELRCSRIHSWFFMLIGIFCPWP